METYDHMLEILKKEDLEGLKNALKEFGVFTVDPYGKTLLFHAVEMGKLKAVETIVFSCPGTGISPQRLALLTHKDKEGNTAESLAHTKGFKDIESFLSSERARMEYAE